MSRVEGGGRPGERGGKGVYNWRRAYARRRAPCVCKERRRRRKVEGPVEKREAIAKKKRKKEKRDEARPAREATKRFVTPRIPAYTRATESYARIPKEDSPPPRRLRSLPFPPPAIFPFCLLLFLFSAPSRAHARFHLLSR